MNVLQKIKEAGFDESRIKLDEAVFNNKKDELTINFMYPENKPITSDEKNQIVSIVNECFGESCKVVVKANKSCFDKEVIYERIEEYIDKHYKALKNEFNREDVTIERLKDGDGAEIIISCDELRKQVFINKKFDVDLRNFLLHKFFFDFVVTLRVDKESTNFQELLNDMPKIDTGLSDALAKEKQLNHMEIELGECFYGKYMPNRVDFIANMSADSGAEIMIAGVVTNLALTSFTSKVKLDGEPLERKKLSFTLTDPSGFVNVVVFPQEKALKSLELMEDGMTVAVGGVIHEFNGNKNLRVNSISKCEIFTKEMKRVYRKVNDDYYFVKPQPVFESQQMELFSLGGKKTDYWDTHDSVVVFDLETTGFDSRSCKIIEIGAVKITKGSIIETFQTLINPGLQIPAEITELTHIDNSMVENAPSIEQALPDFFKFVSGCVLSAYNIDFDYSFLSFNGENLRLKFDNEQIDTLRLVRDKVPSLSNYKLGTVVKALNITLNNAHRALADAYATAKVFVKLI